MDTSVNTLASQVSVDELGRRVTKNEEDIQELYRNQRESAVENAKLSTKLDNILVSLGKLESKVDILSERPSKLWDILITAIVTAVVAGVVGFFIARL